MQLNSYVLIIFWNLKFLPWLHGKFSCAHHEKFRTILVFRDSNAYGKFPVKIAVIFTEKFYPHGKKFGTAAAMVVTAAVQNVVWAGTLE